MREWWELECRAPGRVSLAVLTPGPAMPLSGFSTAPRTLLSFGTTSGCTFAEHPRAFPNPLLPKDDPGDRVHSGSAPVMGGSG